MRGHLFTSMLAVAVSDAVAFHAALDSPYKTPWFDHRWWPQPYTHAALAVGKITKGAAAQPREFWTKNGERSEDWLMREVPVGDVVFWTVLERRPAVAGSV